MKHARTIAFMLTAVMATAIFAGCTARNRNDNVVTPLTPDTASSIEESASRIDEEAYELESGIEYGASEFESSLYEDENSLDESGLYESIAPAMSTDFAEIGALDGTKDTGFPGGPVDDLNRPSGPVTYQQKYGKYDARFIVSDSKKIYLTFDEGYENGYTSRILDTLKDKNVKAVFFITYPYAKSETALVQRMVDEGHTLGNHSTKHQIYPDIPLAEAANDLTTLHDYVLAQYGYKMWLFRPPEGAFSEQTLALAQSLNYQTMLWSFAYKDYDVQNQPLVIEATDKIVSKAHPGEICLLHAVSRTNAEILGDVIDILRDKGYEFADYFYFK